nr:MAG TPA: hypothetical protein [Caudoviricetes sp.]
MTASKVKKSLTNAEGTYLWTGLLWSACRYL